MSTHKVIRMKSRRMGLTALLTARFSRFFMVNLMPVAAPVRVTGVGRRAGQVGMPVATIGLKHASAYEVVVRFADGKEDSFIPMDLVPAANEVQP